MATVLSAFPDTFDEALPEFDASGTLRPGDYAPTRAEFEERFVSLGDRGRRGAIYAGWNKHRDALLSAGLPSSSRQLLDGSYTTSKPSPKDIDIASVTAKAIRYWTKWFGHSRDNAPKGRVWATVGGFR